MDRGGRDRALRSQAPFQIVDLGRRNKIRAALVQGRRTAAGIRARLASIPNFRADRGDQFKF